MYAIILAATITNPITDMDMIITDTSITVAEAFLAVNEPV